MTDQVLPEHVVDLSDSIRMLHSLLQEIAGEGRPVNSRVQDVDLTIANPLDANVHARAAYDLAVQVDNPYLVMLELRASSDGGGSLVVRIPPLTTRIISARVRELSLRALGAPAGVVPATVTRFDQPMQSGTFVYGSVGGAGVVSDDVVDRATRLLGRVSSGVADSLQAAGKVTAPALGAAIATLAAPPAGVYAIEVDLVVSNVSDVNNMKLQRGGVDQFNPILVGSLNVSQHNYRVSLNGAQNVTINAIAAGGAGVVYQAQVIATRVE